MLENRTSIILSISVAIISFALIVLIVGPVNINSNILNVLLAYSVAVLLFPFVSVPIIYDALSKISPMAKGEKNHDALRSLFKDYLDGCFLVSVLAFIEISIILIYLFSFTSGYLGVILISLTVAITVLLFVLLIGLWKIWRIIGSDI